MVFPELIFQEVRPLLVIRNRSSLVRLVEATKRKPMAIDTPTSRFGPLADIWMELLWDHYTYLLH